MPTVDDESRFHQMLDKLPPLEQIRMASSRIDQLRVEMTRLATRRGHAVKALRDQGRSAAEIGTELGISRQQVHRIMREALGKTTPNEVRRADDEASAGAARGSPRRGTDRRGGE